MKQSLLIVLITVLAASCGDSQAYRHHCNHQYKGWYSKENKVVCEFENMSFKEFSEKFPNTGSNYQYDSVHFFHPTWTKSEIQEHLENQE